VDREADSAVDRRVVAGRDPVVGPAGGFADEVGLVAELPDVGVVLELVDRADHVAGPGGGVDRRGGGDGLAVLVLEARDDRDVLVAVQIGIERLKEWRLLPLVAVRVDHLDVPRPARLAGEHVRGDGVDPLRVAVGPGLEAPPVDPDEGVGIGGEGAGRTGERDDGNGQQVTAHTPPRRTMVVPYLGGGFD
jgi:hypothetical protein